MGIEQMSFGAAQEEAASMQEKIEKGEAQNYSEAEKLVKAEIIDIKKISDLNYEDMEQIIPEVAAMKDFNQRSDFHTLTLDEHTKKVISNLKDDEYISTLSDKEKTLTLLAAQLHDLGKTSPEGTQIHPKDPEKRQYVGHEEESKKMAERILPKYFDLDNEDQKYVTTLIELHAAALNLVGNFENNNQPKGKDLKAYDKFFEKAEAIPGNMDMEKKMRIVFAFNKADKNGGYNENSDINSEKVQTVKENAKKQTTTLSEMEKALPALIEAIQARRAGDQKAGIIYENGEYKYKKPEEKKKTDIPVELKKLGGILRDKTKDVAEIYENLKSKKDNEKAFTNIVNGMLKGKLKLSDEQVEAVIKTIK